MDRVISDVNVITGHINGNIIEHTNVYIKDDHIEKISNEIENGWEIIKGKGMTLLPGLINLNGALPEVSGPAWLKKQKLKYHLKRIRHSGVTTLVTNYQNLKDLKQDVLILNKDIHIESLNQQNLFSSMLKDVESLSDEQCLELKEKKLSLVLSDNNLMDKTEGIEKALAWFIPVGIGMDYIDHGDKDYVKQLCLFKEKYDLSACFVIYTATLQNAIILHKEDRIGTIEKGKIADMILVDGNPFENLEALNHIKMVFDKGELVKNK